MRTLLWPDAEGVRCRSTARDARRALEDDLVALARRFDRLGTGGAVAIPAAYTEAVAIKA